MKQVEILKEKYNIKNVDYAIVVGSGLISAAPDLENVVTVEYTDIEMPQSKVQGHSGKFIFGTYKNKNIVLVSRIHYYEFGDNSLVRLPFEIIAKLGVKTCVLLTSCGGINESYKVGDLMLIKDQINMTGNNPLIGIDPMVFTSMTNCYDRELISKILDCANKNDIALKQGVFVQFTGPSYETNAEVNQIRILGGDCVSMSTVYDCIICNYLQMKVCGIANVVNTYNEQTEEVTHKEVLDNAKNAAQKIKTILCSILD